MSRYLRAAMNMPAHLPEDDAEPTPSPNPYTPGIGTETGSPPAPTASAPWGTLVRAWERPKPSPRAWVLPGRVPAGATTILYGDAGTLKTYVAMHIAICVASGTPWLGQPVVQAPVVYVDVELDEDEFLRRGYDLAAGLGMERLPVGVHYFRLRHNLPPPATIPALASQSDPAGAGLVVLDSLGVGCFGSDLEGAAAMTAGMQRWRAWGRCWPWTTPPSPRPG